MFAPWYKSRQFGVSLTNPTTMFFQTILLALCFVGTFSAPKPKSDGCYLDVVYNAPNAPLFVNSTLNFPTPVSPTTTEVFFAQEEVFKIGCPGGSFNYPLIEKGEPVLCHQDTTIATVKSNQILDFLDLTCTLDPAKRPDLFEMVTSDKCENNGLIQSIGYSIDDEWVETFHVCYDPVNLSIFYAKYMTDQWMDDLPSYNSNVRKIWSGIFPVDLQDIYSSVKQRVETLGVRGYITDDVYLEGGFLAPAEHFLSAFQRDTTFDMANAPLRWNTVNSGNWKALENSLEWLMTEGKDWGEVTMFGGTLGVADLPDDNGNPVDLYLVDGKMFPVARWFWKIMHSPSTSSGVIFFVYNNPYVAKPVVDKEFLANICEEDAISEVTWLSGVDFVNPHSGFIYACYMDPYEIIDPAINEVVLNLLQTSKISTVPKLNQNVTEDVK